MVMVSLKFVWFLKWLIRVFCFFRTCLLVTSFLTMCLHQMCETLYDLPKGLRIWINQNCCGPKCHWHQSIKSCKGFSIYATLMGFKTRSVYFGCDGNRYVPSWWLATKQVSHQIQRLPNGFILLSYC